MSGAGREDGARFSPGLVDEGPICQRGGDDVEMRRLIFRRYPFSTPTFRTPDRQGQKGTEMNGTSLKVVGQQIRSSDMFAFSFLNGPPGGLVSCC